MVERPKHVSYRIVVFYLLYLLTAGVEVFVFSLDHT
jgi:hypothetical protein